MVLMDLSVANQRLWDTAIIAPLLLGRQGGVIVLCIIVTSRWSCIYLIGTNLQLQEHNRLAGYMTTGAYLHEIGSWTIVGDVLQIGMMKAVQRLMHMAFACIPHRYI